jgi:hypothetical protein
MALRQSIASYAQTSSPSFKLAAIKMPQPGGKVGPRLDPRLSKVRLAARKFLGNLKLPATCRLAARHINPHQAFQDLSARFGELVISAVSSCTGVIQLLVWCAARRRGGLSTQSPLTVWRDEKWHLTQHVSLWPLQGELFRALKLEWCFIIGYKAPVTCSDSLRKNRRESLRCQTAAGRRIAGRLAPGT